ncbi:MAG: hypothetical protein KDK39_09880 [Leptospiraceae bacterium]|nr:hypothetical protein [Leptospiraceae bacterium]
MKQKQGKRLVSTLLISLFITACVSQTYVKQEQYFPTIESGKTTKSEVLAGMGRSPNGNSSANGNQTLSWTECNNTPFWYVPFVGWIFYIIEGVKCHSFSVSFDKNGVVTSTVSGSSSSHGY